MRTYFGLFILALTSLVLEVLLTKIFDVIMWPNIAFVIISGAMFGLGLGGLFELLHPRPVYPRGEHTAWPALLFAVSVWMLPLLLNAIPFSLSRVGVAPLSQLGYFLLLYAVLLTPFFFAGLCVARIFSDQPDRIHRLYFWDLTGAALGTVILVPTLPVTGPERLLIVAALAALAAAALFADSARWRLGLVGVAAMFAVAPFALGPRYLTLALHADKREVASSIERGRLEFSRWDSVSQISIIDQPRTTSSSSDYGKKHVAYDGGTQSSHFFPFDGDFAALRNDLPNRLMFQFWQRGVLASHYVRRNSSSRVLIIGSAGGQETKAAELYGAAEIDAIELVGTVVTLARGRYADYIGHIFDQPGVHLQVGEGRSFLRASRKTYDIIQCFSNYTSSSVAQGSGAVEPVYLETKEAYSEYFSHLSPNGILQINRYAYPRMITTAAAAWESSGRRDFRRHVAVFEKQDARDDHNPTVMIKMSPWTPAEIADLQQFFAFPADRETPYRFAENPLDAAQSFLPDAFYRGELPSELVRNAPYNIGVVTDDRPYFNFLRRSLRHLEVDRAYGVNVATAAIINSQTSGGWVPMDWLHLFASAAASILFGGVFVFVPMYFSAIGRERWTGKVPALLYFSLLGFGFMAVELLFIQIFMKLIGYPLYTVATVITVMLIGAAVGSMSSVAVVGRDGSRWWVPFVGVITTGVAVWAAYPPVSTYFMATSTSVRVLTAGMIMFPLAFFMGMPFPMGIRQLAMKPRGAIAWAWSMNGLFTTIGGFGTSLLTLLLGFRATILVALTMYVAAWAVFGVLRQNRQGRLGHL